MPKVLGVRFKTSPRMYYFAPTEDEEYGKGVKVVVETQRGIEIATVVMPVTEVDNDKLVAPLKPVLRIATDEDLAAVAEDEAKKHDILALAKQKVAARGLDMKVVDCEFTVDHSKLVLYFTAEQRVDFRELVRDLASAFHLRIDLRQIGAREECKMIGSLGACGLPCCCGRFDSDKEHVSIKMAKNQNLALTPNKINGMCGRLLCCLSYENDTYEDVIKRAPKPGAYVTCPDGRRGTVVSVTPITEKVRVRVGDDDNFEFCDYLLDDLKYDGKPPQKQDGKQDNRQERSQERQQNGKQRDKRGDTRREADPQAEQASTDEIEFAGDPDPEPPPVKNGRRHNRPNNNGNNNNDGTNGKNDKRPQKNGDNRNRPFNKKRGYGNKKFKRDGENTTE